LQGARCGWGVGFVVLDLIGALRALAVCRDVLAPVVPTHRAVTPEWLHAPHESTEPVSATWSIIDAEAPELLVGQGSRPSLPQVVDEIEGQIVALEDRCGRGLDVSLNVPRVFDLGGEGAVVSLDHADPPIRFDRKDLDSHSFHRAIMTTPGASGRKPPPAIRLHIAFLAAR